MWYENGQLWVEYFCDTADNEEFDKIEGSYKMWHRNGQLSIPYTNGKQEGISRSWYDNGQLRSECNYIDDKKNGYSKEWHENGQIKRDEFYCDGVLVSGITYDEDGEAINQISSRAKGANFLNYPMCNNNGRTQNNQQ
jgi:antitoxin component YwqK of YwqJK toxin-antitoxin module